VTRGKGNDSHQRWAISGRPMGQGGQRKRTPMMRRGQRKRKVTEMSFSWASSTRWLAGGKWSAAAYLGGGEK
jgi:hypothetical protein